MAANSNIEWTEATWNCLAGCEAISPGCAHCYAATMTRRLEGMGQADYAGLTNDKHFNGVVRCLPHKLDIPLKRKKPTVYFVNSMSDLFHEDVPDEFIDRVFATMYQAQWHTYQVLTKRADRMHAYMTAPHRMAAIGTAAFALASRVAPEKAAMLSNSEFVNDLEMGMWPLPQVWLGVSAEDQKRADERIPWLLKTPAAVRFVSAEPLLGSINFKPFLGGFHVIEERRRVGLSRSAARGVGNRQRGASVESGGPARGSVGQRHANDSMPEAEGRERDGGRLPASTGDDRRTASERTGASAGVVSPEGLNSDRPDREPQGRQSLAQSPGQSGTGNGIRAGNSLAARARQRRPAGREEPSGEVVNSRSGADSQQTGSRGTPENDCGGLRRGDADDIENRPEQAAIGWVITGGESGPGSRPCNAQWIRDIRQQCEAANVPCFIKQLGARPCGIDCRPIRDKKGGDPAEWPEDLRVRQFPAAAMGGAK